MKHLHRRTKIILTIAIFIAGAVIYAALFHPGKPIVKLTDEPGRVNPQPLFIAPEEVSIMSYGFEPRTVTIKQGQAVIWTNKDRTEHQVIGDSLQSTKDFLGFAGQGALERGDSFMYTFFDKGTFTYHDKFNPATYKGTIIVE